MIKNLNFNSSINGYNFANLLLIYQTANKNICNSVDWMSLLILDK